MAQIKFKHNNQWKALNFPVKAFYHDCEYVEINGGSYNKPFPDLSPYISDFSQIKALMWVSYEHEQDVVISSGGGSGYGNTYDNVYRAITYCYLPLISDKLFRFSHVENQTTSGGNQIMKVDNTYTIGGNVSELKVYNEKNEKVKHYNYYLYLYYDKEAQRMYHYIDLSGNLIKSSAALEHYTLTPITEQEYNNLKAEMEVDADVLP